MSGFINPYNFFPLVEYNPEENGSEERVSGVIKYSIMTKTPLFIPNTEVIFLQDINVDNKQQKHSHMVFNSLELISENGESERDVKELTDIIKTPVQPFIPGSEVRGMIRSEYEMITGSCLTVLNNDNILSKRVHNPFLAGLIKKNSDSTYSLYKAEDCIFRAAETSSSDDAPNNHYSLQNGKREYIGYRQGVFSYKIEDFRTGDKIYFEYNERSKGKTTAKKLSKEETRDSQTMGFIMKGFPGPEMPSDRKHEKHNLHIFCLEKNPCPFRTSLNLESLKTIINIYIANNLENKSIRDSIDEYSEQLKLFINGSSGEEYFPVYYSILKYDAESELNLFLSPSSITRELYNNTIGRIIDDTYKPCSDSKKLCPACALFGRMDEKVSTASHLRFSDLHFVKSLNGEKPDYLGETTLIPLSSPKISNMEFYLQKPEDAIFWTYDYYVTKSGEIRKYDKTINGRKFYWHHSNLLTSDNRSNQNKTVYPLSCGNIFEGELYFDNITTSELDLLIYIINCGETDVNLENKKRGHKLGAGRPAGLGSISAEVTYVCIRKANLRTYSYFCKEYCDYSEPNFPQKENYVKMTSFDNNFSEPVRYPFIEGKDGIFEWFSANHKGVNRNNQNEIVPNREGKIIIDMPNKRNCQLFVEHLVAMQEKTVKTSISLLENDSSTENGVEIAVMTGKANKSGWFVYFTVNGRRGSCKKTDLPVSLRSLDIPSLKGKKIKVRYIGEITGNDGRSYPQFNVIGDV